MDDAESERRHIADVVAVPGSHGHTFLMKALRERDAEIAMLRTAANRVGAALRRCSLEAGFYAEMGVGPESDAAIDEAVSALAALGVQAGPR